MKVRNLIHHLLEYPMDADVEGLNINGPATDAEDAIEQELTESIISIESVEDANTVVLGYTGPPATAD